MRKRLVTLLLTALLVMAAWPITASAAPGGTINVYNWGQYIADGTDGSLDVIAAFEEETGIKVNYVTFDSNETMYTKLKTGGSSYDVIIPSDYMVGRLIAEDMLEPLNFDNIPNYQYVDESFRNTAYDPDNLYSVPYTWGTVGLIYNSKYVDNVTGWSSLWDPQYAGKILMFDNCRDAFAIAELRLGYSINSSDPAEYQEAANLLQQQKPYVQQYVMDQIFSKMEREEAWLAPYYAGDYLTMVEENPDLSFCLPEEGFNMFIDAMCIPKGCANKEGAEAFINFLCDPEISGRNMDYLGYSTPISAAKAYMDPEVANDPVAYPDAETLSRGSSFLALPTESTQLMDSLWLTVKTAGGNTSFYLWSSAAVLILVVGLLIIAKIRKKRRIARRGCSRRPENP